MIATAIVLELALACTGAGILSHRLQTVGIDTGSLLLLGGILAASSISTVRLDRQATGDQGCRSQAPDSTRP